MTFRRSAMMASLLIGWLTAPAHPNGLGGAATPTAPIPDQLQGTHPIHMPEYDGVEQLLVLNDRWVIVVSHTMDELFAEIDRRADGALREAVDRWVASEGAGRPDWGAYRARWSIRDEHIAAAREAIGERELGEPGYFSITSPGDDRYAKPQQPSRADRLLISSGMERELGGVFRIDYMIYSYLELPEPMRDGQDYRIELDNGDHVAFTFDRKATVSRAIKVNQIGYLPDAGIKRAYLGAYLYAFGPLDLSHAKTFEVINAQTGAVALRGDVELLEANPRFAVKPNDQSAAPDSRPLMYGEDVYVADFTALREEGVYFISVPGVGRSWPFRHAADAYGPAFYTAARALFHQRAGMAITDKHSPWTRQEHKTSPYYESENIHFPHHTPKPSGYDRFDVVGGSIDRSKQTEGVPGGWHDAADWDSNDAHYTAVFDLLSAYGMAPHRFTDGQLHLPESGNGVPDLLDEVRYGLEIWRHSMDERGGVSGMLETYTHPKIDDTSVDYAFSQRTRFSSLLFAAAAAQYAQHVQAFNTDDARLYQQAAERAYAFGNNPDNSLGATLIHAKKKRGKGDPYTIEWTETDEHIQPYLLHAKLRLYLLTGDAAYLDGVSELAGAARKPYAHHFSRKDYSPWIYYSIIEAGDALPDELVGHWRQWFIRDADALVELLDDAPYANTWPRHQDYWMAWGASDMTNFSRGLAIAYELTGENRYRDAVLANTDFMLGANPMGMSWTTGLGYVYPIDLQHEMSEHDGIVDPVPGITIYGITGGPIYHRFREEVWQSPKGDGAVDFAKPEHRAVPLWRRWMVHPHVAVANNEFTVHETMASTIFTTAVLLGDDWSPEQSSLLRTAPRRPDQLFGYWYLP